MSKIFLTGITGLVGSAFVVSLLKQRNDTEIVCLTRKSPVKSALDRVRDIVKDQCDFDHTPEAFERIISKISVIDGDVTTIDPEKLAAAPELAGVDVVFHCAADVNLGKDPTGKTFRINYHGTENMLALAKLLKVKSFHYVSTAYVAGKLIGRAMEADPADNGFNNPYEESKCRAERMVRASGFPYTIYRPAIITGRLEDGKIRKPLAFYRILEFLAKLKSHHCSKDGIDPRQEFDLHIHFNTLPSEHIYFVPIDYVQTAITKLFQEPVRNMTYHVTGDSPVSAAMIDTAICNVLNIKQMEISEISADAESKDTKMLTRFIGDLYPYFSSDIVFDQTNVRAGVGKALDWQYDSGKLEIMMREYFYKFHSNVDWIMQMFAKSGK